MRPHYVPAAYLGHFVNRASQKARKEQIWAIRRGTGEQALRSVNDIGIKNRIYDATNDGPAEDYFRLFENQLRKALTEVVKWSSRSQSLTRMEVGAEMLGQSASLITRNVKDSAGSSFGSRLEAAQFWFNDTWLTHVLGGDPSLDMLFQGQTTQDSISIAVARILNCSPWKVLELQDERRRRSLIARAVSRRWDWRVVSAPANFNLLTSDNPAIWVTVRETGNLVLLPISSSEVFVGCTRDVGRFVRKMMSLTDAAFLTEQTIRTSQHYLFSAIKVQEDLVAVIAGHQKENPAHSAVMEEAAWTGETFATVPDLRQSFTFLEAVEG